MKKYIFLLTLAIVFILSPFYGGIDVSPTKLVMTRLYIYYQSLEGGLFGFEDHDISIRTPLVRDFYKHPNILVTKQALSSKNIHINAKRFFVNISQCMDDDEYIELFDYIFHIYLNGEVERAILVSALNPSPVVYANLIHNKNTNKISSMIFKIHDDDISSLYDEIISGRREKIRNEINEAIPYKCKSSQ